MRIFIPVALVALLSGCQDSRVTDLAAENKALQEELDATVSKVEGFEKLLVEFEKQRSVELEKQLTTNVEAARKLTAQLNEQVEAGKSILETAEESAGDIESFRNTSEENAKISRDANALVSIQRTVDRIERFLRQVQIRDPQQAGEIRGTTEAFGHRHTHDV